MSLRWNAADYASHSQGQFNWAMSVIERLALNGGERVLDIGCGDGKVTADAQALDLPGRFDLAFSNAALHWVPDLSAVGSRLARLLAPRSRVFLSMGGRGTAALVFAALDSLGRSERWAGFLRAARRPYHFRGPDEVELVLRESGFTSSRVELIAKPLRLSDREALTGWLRTTWMWTTEPMPEAMRPEFLDALTEAVAPACGRDGDGALLLPMVNLEVEAQLIAES